MINADIHPNDHTDTANNATLLSYQSGIIYYRTESRNPERDKRKMRSGRISTYSHDLGTICLESFLKHMEGLLQFRYLKYVCETGVIDSLARSLVE